ncbi:MAG: hypothetical protein ABL949_07390 [Fimbriimonadaceae bacterium]
MHFLAFAGRVIQQIISHKLERHEIGDPWREVGRNIQYQTLGNASRHSFDWYFEGQSKVNVTNIAQVQNWLLSCTYKPDLELFNEADFWQHPITFENLRKGDCDDHAIWAWRKLVEIGVQAHLYIGKLASSEPLYAGWDIPQAHLGHAWVIIDEPSHQVLFEATAKKRNAMLKPLGEVKEHYVPYFSVAPTHAITAYAGWFLGCLDNAKFQP